MKLNIKSLLYYTLVPVMLSFTVNMLIDFDNVKDLKKVLELSNIFFIIAWALIYIITGISMYLIENKKESIDNNIVYKLYYINLLLSYLYPFTLFYFSNIVLSTVITISLLVINIINCIKLYKLNKASFIMFCIYSLYLVFALYLQLGIFYLNMNYQ